MQCLQCLPVAVSHPWVARPRVHTQAWIDGFFNQYNSLVTQASTVIVTWYGGRLVVTGQLSFGFLMAYFSFQASEPSPQP